MKFNIIKTLPVSLIAVLACASTLRAEPEDQNDPLMDPAPAPGLFGPGFPGKQHPGEMREKMDPGRHLLRIADRLDLTDEQEMQILKLSQQFRKDMDANLASTQEARKTLRQMRENQSFDEDTFRKTLNALQPSMVEGMVLHAKYKDAIGEILTDEQKAKFDEMKGQFKDRVHHLKDAKGKFKERREDRRGLLRANRGL